jgi:hypothetical protein
MLFSHVYRPVPKASATCCIVYYISTVPTQSTVVVDSHSQHQLVFIVDKVTMWQELATFV